MSTRIKIDPISRIEGHLRIDAEVDGGLVSKAWASCTMWRGIENILIGRDPREAWLFVQRFCGVCTTVHALASVRAVEDALKLQIPPNAQYIRNLILIHHALHDHIVHFYHLSALDWIDVMQIPKADPAKTASLAQSLSSWTRNSPQEFKAAQDKVKALAASGQLGIFANGYWGHPAMHLPPEVSLLGFTHYLQALEFQRKANQVVAILGGKTPHIQNLTVGGVANAIDLDSLGTLTMDRLTMIRGLIDEVIPFVHEAIPRYRRRRPKLSRDTGPSGRLGVRSPWRSYFLGRLECGEEVRDGSRSRIPASGDRGLDALLVQRRRTPSVEG